MEKLLYNMLREYYYEKNGLESSIEFLRLVIQELEKINKNKEI